MEGMQHGEGSSQHTEYARSGFGQGLGVEESGDRLVDDAGEVSSDLVACSDGGELSSQVPEGSQSDGVMSLKLLAIQVVGGSTQYMEHSKSGAEQELGEPYLMKGKGKVLSV